MWSWAAHLQLSEGAPGTCREFYFPSSPSTPCPGRPLLPFLEGPSHQTLTSLFVLLSCLLCLPALRQLSSRPHHCLTLDCASTWCPHLVPPIRNIPSLRTGPSSHVATVSHCNHEGLRLSGPAPSEMLPYSTEGEFLVAPGPLRTALPAKI